MGVETVTSAGRYDFGGARLGFCCLACRNAFEADPAEVIKAGIEKGKAFAEFAFDPVSRMRVDAAKSTVEPADFRGIRYFFQSEANRAAFLKYPADLTKTPPREATYCFGERTAKDGYAKALGYRDYEGVRYYLYCPGCLALAGKDPAGFAALAKEAVRLVEPHPVAPPNKPSHPAF